MRQPRRSDTVVLRQAIVLIVFVLALAIPAGLLGERAWRQMRWQVFHQHRLMAESFSTRIDTTLRRLIAREEARAFDDYTFLVSGDADGARQHRSPLADFPVADTFPGVLGYFQVDSLGRYSSPLVPAADVDYRAHGVSESDYAARVAYDARLRAILGQTDVRVGAAGARRQARSQAPASTPRPESAADRDTAALRAPAAAAKVFERLVDAQREASTPVPSYGELAEGRLGARYSEGAADDAADRIVAPTRIRAFDSELEPLHIDRLDTQHFVLFRNAWRDGQRYIQGLLLDAEAFVDGAIERSWSTARLAATADLAIAWRGEVIALAQPDETATQRPMGAQQGELLYRTRLSAPLAAFELVYSVRRLPLGASAAYLLWVGSAMALVLACGVVVIVRGSRRQQRLIRQQQDFVSAVSHELKTPLTTIRLYSEMLEAGWVDEAKKSGYYSFIRTESERLSRLIANVLTLARMQRGQGALSLVEVPLDELLARVSARLVTQAEAAGFILERHFAPGLGALRVAVDEDAFTQILINLVDNAIKFTPLGNPRRLELSCAPDTAGRIRVALRDHGSGVPPAQMRRIFERFYRVEDSANRATVGTGIGLALVHELASAMGASVAVENRDPGAEFSLSLPPVRG